MEEKLELQGIYSNGYGTVAKKVMRDKTVSLAAKGIYSYLCSFCGGGTTCFPSRETICNDLGINKDTFTKHIKQLVDKNYITIQHKKINNNNKFCTNIYVVNLIVKEPCPNFSDTEFSDTKNSDTNNNNINKKEKEEEFSKIIDFYNQNITLITPFVAEDIEKYLDQEINGNLIIAAMEEAVSRNKRHWNYTKSILEDCINNNVRTAEQYRIRQKEFKSNNNKTQQQVKTKEKVEYKENTMTEEEYFKKLKGEKNA